MDFWIVHGWWFLLAIICFPRLTMLFATSAAFGPFAWLGWLVWPNLLAAILATTFYWQTNPVLCICAWLLMLSKTGGTASKTGNSRKVN